MPGVRFDQVGTRLYDMQPVGGNGRPLQQTWGRGSSDTFDDSYAAIDGGPAMRRTVVGEVRARRNGTNVLILRSPVRFHNATETTLELWLHAHAAHAPGIDPGPSGLPASSRARSSPSHRAASSDKRLLGSGESWAVPLDLLPELRHGVSVRPFRSSFAWPARTRLDDLSKGSTFFVCRQRPDPCTASRPPPSLRGEGGLAAWGDGAGGLARCPRAGDSATFLSRGVRAAHATDRAHPPGGTAVCTRVALA